MIYVIFFSILVLGVFIMNKGKDSRSFLLVTMIILWLIIGLRYFSVGTDTLSYIEDFMSISHMSFSEMWNYALTTKEPLYVIISWLPSLLSPNYTLFLLIWALFPVVSLYKIFNRKLHTSIDYLIAILVYFLLGMFAFNVAGIRQTAALSLVFYAGSEYISALRYSSVRALVKDKAICKCALFVVLAYLIHNSSILFLLAIPCLLVKVRWWYLLCVFGSFILGKYVHIEEIVLFSEILFKDRYAAYGTVYESSQNISALIMQVILFLICFSVKDKLINRNVQNRFFFNMMLLGLIFQSLSGSLAEMARISFYFSMFAMLLVPRAFNEYSNKIRSFLYLGFVIVGLYYLFFLTSSNLPKYHSVLYIL